MHAPLVPFACANFRDCGPHRATADAHLQPTTLALLDISTNRVELNLHLPLTELEVAFGHNVAHQPEAIQTTASEPLRQYLIAHIHPSSPDGRAWWVEMLDMSLARSDQAQSGPFQEVNVRLAPIPPTGYSVRRFRLDYDVIAHQVVTHKALFSIHTDRASGRTGETQMGVVAVDNRTLRVPPVYIDLGEGGLWPGFLGTVRMGMEHIRGGLDHLLFLTVLLLSAMHSRKVSENLLGLLRIVSAFTLGHSATLALGALHWLIVPQRPIEVLIAFSILVTAVHAMRATFAGRELYIAAGFGPVHGLTFASARSDLKLPAGPLVLSIPGFNIGIGNSSWLPLRFPGSYF